MPVLLLGISSGIVGGIFTLLLKQGKIYAAKLLPNPVIRIALCGSVLAMFLLLSGHGRYAGLGTDLIALACDGGTVYWFDFLCKLLFTVCTLAIGFQGGEVTPLFAIGACLGAALAPLFGISPVFAARTLLCRRFRQCFQYMARSDLHRNRSVRIRVPALFRRCLHRFPPLQRQPFHVRQTETGSAVFAGAKIRHVFKKPYMIAHVRLLRKQISQRGLRESRFSSGMHTPPHRFPRIATGK